MNIALANTLPGVESVRESGAYRRPTSSTLEVKAQLVRELAVLVKAGDLSPKIIGDKLESLAQGLEVDAGAVLALEAQARR